MKIKKKRTARAAVRQLVKKQINEQHKKLNRKTRRQLVAFALRKG